MKVFHINTYDQMGGAARAAYRLHTGLLGMRVESRMLVRWKHSREETIRCADPGERPPRLQKDFSLIEAVQEHYIRRSRTPVSNTLFSFPYPGIDISVDPEIQGANIANLHWVADFLSSVTLGRLFRSGKPIVWTLHDQEAFSGGCHYSAGCKGYENGCRDCPQLQDDPLGLPAAVLKDKQGLFEGADLTIVTPSRWMAECARRSLLFGGRRIEVIPNGLETNVFKPSYRPKAKERIGLNPDTRTILFGAEYGTEKRKGFAELMRVLSACRRDPDFEAWTREERICLLCFGYPAAEWEQAGLKVMSLGYLSSQEAVRNAYVAADVFVQSSLEDNLPNTMIEAMSCGTPVVAFAVGGMPDVIRSGENGILLPPGDINGMAIALVEMLSDVEKRAHLGRNARRCIIEHFSLHLQAGRYLTLYESLLKDRNRQKRPLKDAPAPRDGADEGFLRGDSVWSAEFGTHVEKLRIPLRLESFDRMTRFLEAENDTLKAESEARLRQVFLLTEEVGTFKKGLARKQAEMNEMSSEMARLEKDRIDRGEQIARLREKLAEMESESADRLDQIHHLDESTVKLNQALKEKNETEEQLLAEVRRLDADRVERGGQIERLLEKLAGVEEENAKRLDQIHRLDEYTVELNQALKEKNETEEQLLAEVRRLDADRIERGRQITITGKRLKDLEEKEATRLKQIGALYDRLEKLEAVLQEKAKAEETLLSEIARLEEERRGSVEQIESLMNEPGRKDGDSAARIMGKDRLIASLGKKLKVLEKDLQQCREALSREAEKIALNEKTSLQEEADKQRLQKSLEKSEICIVEMEARIRLAERERELMISKLESQKKILGCRLVRVLRALRVLP